MQADPRSPSAHRFKLFWQPGCSSCVRTKEFLQKRGVAPHLFETAQQAHRFHTPE